MESLPPLKPKRYIAVLCCGAFAILLAGVLLRPSQMPAPVRSESEFLQLQLMAQKRDLERRSLFFQTTARQLVAKAQEARTNPNSQSEVRPGPGDLLMLVATDAAGQPVWATASAAGVTATGCKEKTLEEIGTTISIPTPLENAAAFNLDGNLAGFVVGCEGRRILTTSSGFLRWQQPTFSENLRACCGIEVAAAGDGIEISSIDPDSRFARSGARAADRIVELNGNPVLRREDLTPLFAQEPAKLAIERGSRKRRVILEIPEE